MQTVNSFCFLLLLLLIVPLSLFAQEGFKLDQTYFQDEVIRKVSVGDGGVWVIKGADSTGVGKLEADGRELDYSHTVNSTVPLTGIVGKYGDSAMIATQGNYLLMYDKGNVTMLDDENGIFGNIINDIQGTPNYTRAATNWGARESYDNQQFSAVNTNAYARFGQKVLRVGKGEDYSVMASITRDSNCFPIGEDVFNIIIKTPATLYQTYFQLNGENDLNALATNQDGRSYYLTLFLGNKSGLRVRNWECRSRETLLLQDTTVYSVSKFEDLMLIGTEKGLFTCPDRYPKQALKIDLNLDYEVYDIAVQKEEGIIWLATDKGLLKLHKEKQTMPKVCEIEPLEWVRNIGSQFPDNSFSTLSDKQGNVFMAGYFQGAVNFGDSTIVAQNQKDFFIAKYNAAGKLIWARSAGNSGSAGKYMDEAGEFLALDADGNVYVTLRVYNTYTENDSWEVSFGSEVKINSVSGSGRYIVKYDKSGTALWVNSIPYYDDFEGFQMDADREGNLYLSMKLGINNPYNLAAGRGIVKFSPDFELLWAKHFSERLDLFKLKKSGEFYLSGRTDGTLTIGELEIEPETRQELVIVFFDQNGTPTWWKNFGGYARNAHIRDIRDIGYDLQGNTFIAGDFTESLDFGDGNIMPEERDGLFVARINAIGDFEWVHTGSGGSPYVRGLEVDSLGAAYVSLSYRGTLTIGNRTYQAGEDDLGAFVAKFGYAGDLSWAYSVPGLKIESKGIARDHKNNLYLSGTLTENIRLNGEELKAGGGTNIFLAKITDTTSPLNRNLVRGKTYFDKNKNNVFDEGDEPLSDHIIKAEPGPVYAKSDPDGNYYLFLNKGNHSIHQIIPEHKGKRVSQTSPGAAYQLSLEGTKADTSGYDFGHDVQLSPYLSVDVSSTRFRRCFTNNTVVEYCNEGFATAENVQLVLEYPEYVIPQSSNIPWSSKSGQKLTFNIGTLQPGVCKSIILTDSVMCGDESIRGQVQCIKAYMSPDNVQEINPAWDQSDIELSAECKDNGFVRLNILNNGAGDMADSAVFRIYLSEALSYTGKYKLQKEESLSLNVLANGKALHLEAELTPFHPQKRTASISIDGCDEKGNPQVQHHFTNQFPQEDDKANYEMSCLEIIDSYDPNDKLVIPAGISAERYVAEGSLLEYTIRFQNTGTDTAYTVVITDLLDKNLDIASLEMGLSSHPVKWALSGEGEGNINISWRFDRINLPDSTTNEKASHGFVKFKIRPKKEAGFGTAIRNQAAIYFDYNSPIITNETLTTLGIPETPPPGGILLQDCGRAVSLQQEEDVAIILCETDSLRLSRLDPAPGGGIWSILKGEGTIEDKNNPNTLVEGIAYGENIFQWEVNYCDVLLRSTVTVIREKLPAAPLINPVPDVCQDDPLPVMIAKGAHVEWYADAALTRLLGSGNTYQAEVSESAVFYVIQQNEHCRSQPAIAELNVLPQPAPPVAASVEICMELDNAVVLTAEGNNIRWYAEQELNTLIGEGTEYQLAERQGRDYFVTQSSDYCESDPTRVVVSTRSFDSAKAFIANVITPNGDKWNQSFYVNEFETEECLGDFIGVKIFNRLGNLVFESNGRDFHWDAGKVNPGIYFYSLEFAVRKFNGSVQVLQ